MKLLLGSLFVVTSLAMAQPAAESSSKRQVFGPEQNYQIVVEIKEGKEKVTEIKVVTIGGQFKVQTLVRQKVKIDDNEYPITLTLDGTLDPLDADRCRLQLFLGRTQPYVTASSDGPAGRRSQIQQSQLGFNTTVVLTNGKPLLIQSDEVQQLTLSLKRL